MNIDIRTGNNFYKASMAALFQKNLGKISAARYDSDTLKVIILPDNADCIFLPFSADLLEADHAVIFCTPVIKRILAGLFNERSVCFISLEGKESVLIDELLAAMSKISHSTGMEKRRKSLFETLTTTETRTLDFIMHTGQGETLSKTQSLHKRNAMHKLGVVNTFELYCKIKLAEALAAKVKGAKGAYIDFLHTKGKFAGDSCSSFEAYALSVTNTPMRHVPSDRFGSIW